MIIYKATNKINGNSYIGQTIKDLKIRKRQHELDALNSRGNTFSKAIKKHGEDNFTWEILECVDSIENIDRKEIYWINHFNTFNNGYNETEGGKTLSSKTYSRKSIDKSNETKRKRTPEQRKVTAMRQARTKGLKTFLVYSIEGDFIGEYENGSWAQKELSIGKTCITSLLSNRRNSCNGYIAVFKDDFTNDWLQDKLLKVSLASQGERNPKAKMTEEDVRAIKTMIKNGRTREEIKTATGVGESIYQAIKYESSWKHVIVEGFNENKRKLSKSLSDDIVRSIKRLLSEGALVKNISKKLNIPYETVYNISKGKTFKNVN